MRMRGAVSGRGKIDSESVPKIRINDTQHTSEYQTHKLGQS